MTDDNERLTTFCLDCYNISLQFEHFGNVFQNLKYLSQLIWMALFLVINSAEIRQYEHYLVAYEYHPRYRVNHCIKFRIVLLETGNPNNTLLKLLKDGSNSHYRWSEIIRHFHNTA